MANTTNKSGPPGLFDKINSTPNDRLLLQQAAQLAMQVEFTTIPTYLIALYSISDTNSEAYQLLRSVVMEEMLHLNLAANLLVAIGGRPRFTGTAVPQYPGYLPQANPKTTPYVGLYRASIDVFANVFAAIERPAPSHAPAQGNNYDTIAQLYDSLVDGMMAYQGKPPLFTPNPKARQRTNIYLGKFGGTPIEITDMETAKWAVNEIVEQGEGSVPIAEPLVPAERWGSYNHYGKRTDGTYGPIIGTPFEMSHFTKFRNISLDTANFPPTYPIISNARYQDLTNPDAIKKAQLFDTAYSVMLDAFDQSFIKPSVEGDPDPFFAVVLPIMHHVLPNLARTLMQTPAQTNGDNSVGPNAAPMFLYKPKSKLADLTTGIQQVLGGTNDVGIAPLLEQALSSTVKIAAAVDAKS